MAAVDYFLKLDGIDGESTDQKHKGEIDIESFSWGQTNTTSRGAGGGGAGKVSVQDFNFVSRLGAQSPVLMLSCASGKHIKKAVLFARKAGSEQHEFMKVTMEDLVISSYQVGGSSGGDVVPTEQFALNFAKIEIHVTRQNADGTIL